MQITEIINNVAGFSAIFCGIAGGLIYPIIFVKIIIPKMEKQIGKRLDFGQPALSIIPMFVAKVGQIYGYIVWKYTISKITKCPSTTVAFFSTNPLQRVNYKVEDAPKFAIFMCFAEFFSGLWFFIGTALIYFKIIH